MSDRQGGQIVAEVQMKISRLAYMPHEPEDSEQGRIAFITMLIDRLHALEMSNDKLQERVALLESSAIYMRSGQVDYNDGFRLSPGFGERPDCLCIELQNDEVSMPMDNRHLDAPMFKGSKVIALPDGTRAALPETGGVVTVRTVLDALSCWAQTKDPATNDTNLRQCFGHVPRWGGLTMFENDATIKLRPFWLDRLVTALLSHSI